MKKKSEKNQKIRINKKKIKKLKIKVKF